MPTVTVTGAHGQTVSLNFDTAANAALAQQLAAAITAGVQDGSILPAVDTDGPPPPLPPGATGLFVQDPSGLTILPPGYKAYVDTSPQAVVFGSGDGDESGTFQRWQQSVVLRDWRLRHRGCRRRQQQHRHSIDGRG